MATADRATRAATEKTGRSERPAARVSLEVLPATPERWPDLVDLFTRPGPRGGQPVTSACWCMWWRSERRDFSSGWGTGPARGRGNRAGLRRLVQADRVPGLLAYREGRPVGWVSVAPRSEYPRLDRSPDLKPVDDAEVWSITCFYVNKQDKGTGIADSLVAAAIAHARAGGARIVEAYPAPRGHPDPFTGFESLFERAGFKEVARRSPKGRSIWRRRVRPAG